MTKHTPGPWMDSYRFTPAQAHLEVYASGVRCVAKVFNADFTQAEKEANARLIASAPDLLEALKLAANEINDLNHVLHTNGEFVNHTIERGFRRIIAKATGEGS